MEKSGARTEKRCVREDYCFSYDYHFKAILGCFPFMRFGKFVVFGEQRGNERNYEIAWPLTEICQKKRYMYNTCLLITKKCVT